MPAMERADGPQTPFEVYCFHCSVTFPTGTRRCVHCGGPIGRRGLRVALQGRPELAAEFPVEEEAPAEPSPGRRIGGLTLWILLGLGAALSRLCSG
jgi:hypothetical protein